MSRPSTALALAVTLLLGTTGCSSSADDGGSVTSVLELVPGQCVNTDGKPAVEVSQVRVVPCKEAHTREVFAVEPYRSAPSAELDPAAAFPGNEVLTRFANNTCAGRYKGYVGADYRRSAYFYTYLIPGPRSWSGTGTGGAPVEAGGSGSGEAEAGAETGAETGASAERKAVERAHAVVCFVKTSGPVLTASVKGTRG